MIEPLSSGPIASIPDLEGKVVLITGGSVGIGAAAALAFAANRCKVAINYHRSQEAAEELAQRIERRGGQALLAQGDVTDPATAPRVVAETVAGFGRLDVLVNNAGDLITRVATSDYTDGYVDSLLNLNVKQVARFVREATIKMRAQGNGGVIINVSSIGARLGGATGSVIYAATKAFVSNATRGWAKELAGFGIRVNAVSPGVILTRFHDRYSTPEVLDATKKLVPLGRLGQAEDVAGAFLYLASNSMSGYVTGQTLEVNGGQYMA